ncbi:hypothetical protein KI387_020182 [Taxus chinensis]|uniref:Uncharacterized protein n=1 Tax=Taxus chinensis TaxID=29808 RepID=A0AA38GBD4_TAXCH|nr:hypothetical protein KI387_020182 [Taxus chinensis]
MQDTLKAIELHQRGVIHSVVLLLNKKVDSLSSTVQQLSTNVQQVPDQVSNSLQSHIQQSIYVVFEGTEKKVIDSIQTINEKLSNLCFSVSELEQYFHALTSAVNKLESSQSDKSSISSSSPSTNPDWSKAITWAQVAAMKSPLSKEKEKKIGMARLTAEEAKSVIDEGYDYFPTFHCNMIRSSYDHPFIPPSSIVLKQKLDQVKKDLAECPPYLGHRHYSLQSQLYDLQIRLEEKIKQENAEDLRLAQYATSIPQNDPYHFVLSPGRGRGRDHPSSSRGRDHQSLRHFPSRHFPFLFPEEE